MVVTKLPAFEKFGSLFSYRCASEAFIEKIENLRSQGKDVKLGYDNNEFITCID